MKRWKEGPAGAMWGPLDSRRTTDPWCGLPSFGTPGSRRFLHQQKPLEIGFPLRKLTIFVRWRDSARPASRRFLEKEKSIFFLKKTTACGSCRIHFRNVATPATRNALDRGAQLRMRRQKRNSTPLGVRMAILLAPGTPFSMTPCARAHHQGAN